MFEAAVSTAVAGDIGRGFVANGQRGGAPQFAGVIITQIERFAWTVGNGIVRPRRELVFAAVDGPCVAASLSRRLKAEGRIGDDVDPWRGRRLARAKNRHIFLAALGKSAEPVEIFEIRHNGLCRRRRRWVFALFGRLAQASWARPNSIQLIEQTAKPRDEHDPRHGRKKGRRSLRYQVRS